MPAGDWLPSRENARRNNSLDIYTERELRRIHKVFGHPYIRATEIILKRPNNGKVDVQTKKARKEIVQSCQLSKSLSETPRRYKLTICTNYLRFNKEAEVDTILIRGTPVLYMIDMATGFPAD